MPRIKNGRSLVRMVASFILEPFHRDKRSAADRMREADGWKVSRHEVLRRKRKDRDRERHLALSEMA